MKKKSTNHTENLTAADLEVLHEAGGDMRPHRDLANARRPGRETQRVIWKVARATTDEQISACFPVMKFLRPHLEKPSFLEKVRRQEAAGYRLVFVGEKRSVVSVAGFRVLEFMAWGKVLYIDDLITDPEKRGQGHAGALLDWLIGRARAERCDELHLDTGYQRHAAHRLYLNKGFELSCHHLALKLGASDSG